MSTTHRITTALTATAVGVLAAATIGTGAAVAAPPAGAGTTELRVATYNLSLNRNVEGQLVTDLSTTTNAQAKTVAEIIQRANPDIVLLNEFDFDAEGEAADLFRENYLEVSQGGADPVVYPYAYVAPSNTGIASGFDLNNNGAIVTTPGAPGYGDDAFGFGAFEGQFGMAVLSKYPIDVDAVRTFQNFLWKDMPGALLPDDPNTAAPADWYSAEELAVFRLSSKSHWDVPIDVNGRTVHALVSHPTPPTFDGLEDRNGKRNHDEIRFWADYVTPGTTARYIYDDAGATGRPQARRVVRDPRRPERRPARRRLGGPGDRPAARPPAHHRPAADLRGCRRGRGAAGRREPHAPGRPGARHRRLQRQPGAGQPACRLRAAVARPAGTRRGGVLAGAGRPAVGAHGHVPVPVERPPARVGRREGARLTLRSEVDA